GHRRSEELHAMSRPSQVAARRKRFRRAPPGGPGRHGEPPHLLQGPRGLRPRPRGQPSGRRRAPAAVLRSAGRGERFRSLRRCGLLCPRGPGRRPAREVARRGRPRTRFTQRLRGRHRPVTSAGDTFAMTTRVMGEGKGAMATRRRTSEPAQSASPKPGQRVLVVEDEQDVAELIRYNLAKEGYDVAMVGNGADALKRARESKPEVILLGIMVPQLNGWEVCRRLKQDPE